MTAVVEPSRPVVEWPAWQVPARAAAAWLRLQVAIVAVGRRTPCEVEPELWFSRVQSPRVAEAVEACRWCPVLEACRSYALEADERHGVWGGLTEVERRTISGRSR